MLTLALPVRILDGVANEVTTLLLDLRALHDAGDVLPLQGEVDTARIIEENQQVQGLAPVQADLVATSVDGVCRVQGQLRTEITYTCSRCLDEYDSEFKVRFDELFSNRVSRDDVHLLEDAQVDLDPYIEEAVNLAIEYRPLCREDCQGLCPVCGMNLNHGQCNCDRTVTDPRWAMLEHLLDKKPES